MSPRPDVSEERVRQVLDAAGAVFARSGFSETRMDDIAAAAGLSKGALYLYFPGKEGIINILGCAFADHRLMTLFIVTLPALGLAERYGLQEQSAKFIRRISAATVAAAIASSVATYAPRVRRSSRTPLPGMGCVSISVMMRRMAATAWSGPWRCGRPS